jgi:hypothetical protein
LVRRPVTIDASVLRPIPFHSRSVHDIDAAAFRHLDRHANICSMGAEASPLVRLRRALSAGSLAGAEAAARELPFLDDEDALRLLLLLHRERDGRYERAATRFLGRVLATHPRIGFVGTSDLLDGLQGLGGPAPEVARSRIASGLRQAGLKRAAKRAASE